MDNETQQGGLVKQNRRVPQQAYKTGERSALNVQETGTLEDNVLYLITLKKLSDREVWYMYSEENCK